MIVILDQLIYPFILKYGTADFICRHLLFTIIESAISKTLSVLVLNLMGWIICEAVILNLGHTIHNDLMCNAIMAELFYIVDIGKLYLRLTTLLSECIEYFLHVGISQEHWEQLIQCLIIFENVLEFLILIFRFYSVLNHIFPSVFLLFDRLSQAICFLGIHGSITST